jgi:hypothetical protein
MKKPRLSAFGLAVFASLAALPGSAHAQLPNTRLYSVFPAGAQAGAAAEVKITSGDDLEEIAALRFNHPGIQAKPKMPEGATQPIENTFDVTVAADVPPGVYEVYAQGYFGWSNPRAFVVGSRKELNETEPNQSAAQANPVELGTTINGRLEQGADTDFFKFTAKKGARIIADCWASRIDSRLTPVVEIYNLQGRKLTHDQSARHDVTLAFEAPEDGEYLLKLFDQAYKGGQDYFYRLDLHNGPYVSFTVPPIAQVGTTVNASLYGFNLPGGELTDQKQDKLRLERLNVAIPVPNDAAMLELAGRMAPVEAGMDGFTWKLDTPQGASNPVSISMGQWPAVVEVEPNDQPAQAQMLTVPCEVGGQFATIGDVDTYAFDVKAGATFWIEVLGERLGHDVDPTLIVEHVTKDAEGKETVNRLTVQTDLPLNLAPNAFDTQSDDVAFKYVAPSDGRCRVTVKDAYGETRGDPEMVYALRIHPETPDFRVVALPIQTGPGQAVATTLRKGDDFSFNVLAFRRDGFNGAIEVRAEGLPAGVTSTGTVIGPSQNSALLTLTTAIDTPEALASIRLIGHAAIEKPELAQARAAATAARDAAAKALAELRTNAGTETQKLQQATEQLTAALKTDAEKSDDATRQAVTEKQKQLEATQAGEKAAIEKLIAGGAKVAETQAALQAAKTAADAAVAQVDHSARIATVIWSTANNRPAVSRIAREFPIGISKEAASYEIRPQMAKAEVRQGGLVLVPVKLERRNGFDGEVQVAINGKPGNANIDAANFKFEKDKNEFLLPLFVKDNSPPDSYAVYLTGTAQVSYRRNPEKADREKAAFDAQAAIAKTAQDAAQKATDEKNTANQKATEAAQKLQQDQQTQQTAANALKVATDQVQAAKTTKDAADKKATDTATALKQSDDALAAAKKALEADANNEGLKQAVTTAEQTAANAKTAADTAATEQANATKALADLETAAKTADEANKKALEAIKLAETAKTDADIAKAAAEKAEQDAQNAAKNEEEKRKQAEQRSNQAAQAAAAKNLNFTPNSSPIVVVVKPAPIKLSASVANGGQVKRGEKLEIKTAITRQNSFTGPVTLSLVLPPGVAGLSAEATPVPADKNEGMLTITAAADAMEGELKNIVVRANCDFDGPAAVDSLVVLKVVP